MRIRKIRPELFIFISIFISINILYYFREDNDKPLLSIDGFVFLKLGFLSTIPLYFLLHWHTNSSFHLTLNSFASTLLLLFIWCSWLHLLSLPLLITATKLYEKSKLFWGPPSLNIFEIFTIPVLHHSSQYKWITIQISKVSEQYEWLMMYIPILFVAFQDPQKFQNRSNLNLCLLHSLWDTPIMLWMYTMSLLGGRALKPFYSEIDSNMSLGSMPLPGDSKILHHHNVGLVVNLCREFQGLIKEYEDMKIEQLQLPTPDISVPSFENLILGVDKIISFIGDNPNKRVFVHCKGDRRSRSRSNILCLCYLVSQGYAPREALDLMIEKREVVVDDGILKLINVQRFVRQLGKYNGNFERMKNESLFQEKAKACLMSPLNNNNKKKKTLS